MLSSLCRRVLRHLVIRSREVRGASYAFPSRKFHLNNIPTVRLRTLASCVHFSTATPPLTDSVRPEQQSVEEVVRRFSSRQRDWHFRPIDSLLSALKDTDPEDRVRNCLSILGAFRSVAGGRGATSEHLEQLWNLVTEEGGGAPSAEAELLWLQLYRDAALPPPAPLTDAVAARAEPESVGHLVRCLCAAGRLADTAPLLERLRGAGHQPPLDALHAVIVAHAADGDLDTARDMAQALLPAASEDDSDHQLLLMRVYIAARRPGPLAALLSRWYQQRGQLTLGQGVSLLGQLVSSGQLEQLQQVVPLVPWPRWGHHWGGCVRLQRRLVRLGQHRAALLLLNTALSYGGSERELARLARALLTEMAVTDQPVSAIGEVCAALHDGPLLPTAWFSAAEVLYRVGRWKAALEVLLAARRAGLPLREHLFWPALLQQAREGSVEGVRDTLSEMVSAGAPPGLETLREYALPVYERDAWPPPERVVQHLKEAGLTAAAAADALVARLLASGHWHKAAAACERYASSVSVAVLIPAILYSAQQPAGPAVPADACARLLRCALDRRAAHEDPVGAVFVELSQTAARSPRQAALLRQLVQAAGPAGLRMSPAAAELACERLPPAELADLQSALQRLADAAVSSQPWENTDAGAGLPQDASVDDLEDHLVELTKKGGNTRGILRKLILMHCRKHNLERAVELEEELSRVSGPAADGEPLTPGVLSALLAVHVHHGRLEGALDYQRRLERSPGAGRFLDQFKRLDLAALLMRRGHSDDAVSLLERLEPEDDRSRLSMGCWRLLAAAADWGDPELTGRLLRLLETRGVVAPTAHHRGQMVRAHLVSGDVAGAVEQFCRCARDHRLAAYSHGLMVEVARLENSDRRHQLLDDVAQQLAKLHGADAAQYELALALAEAGHVVQARRVMQTLGRSAHFSGDRLKRHCSRLARAGDSDALVTLLQAVPHKEARQAVYWALLNAYERTEDLASVEDVLSRLQEDELLTGKIVAHARRLAERLRSR
ncbi:leucine-rich PPR motif-containing protein, mitochondrial-like [Amphibalanus amphitrite]|uniref:leucine-rich PPR motif-containing protein, mitochondrial-like n=1 Tax=Amphibalanus amphitrite TaxID=1232801 RepID=UPI001C91F7D3|nr:leucine-rich PPR motif-containing protein, mitochondrial-like [Amphibalanus amphitrite]